MLAWVMDERAISDPVSQTAVADEMFGDGPFYPFPRRAARPSRAELRSLLGADGVVLKRRDGPELLLSRREALSRDWGPDDVAQEFIRGRRIFMTGFMRRGDGAWIVDTSDADAEELAIVQDRLRGLGALINASTLSVDGSWGALVVAVTVTVRADLRIGRVTDARLRASVPGAGAAAGPDALGRALEAFQPGQPHVLRIF